MNGDVIGRIDLIIYAKICVGCLIRLSKDIPHGITATGEIQLVRSGPQLEPRAGEKLTNCVTDQLLCTCTLCFELSCAFKQICALNCLVLSNIVVL